MLGYFCQPLGLSLAPTSDCLMSLTSSDTITPVGHSANFFSMRGKQPLRINCGDVRPLLSLRLPVGIRRLRPWQDILALDEEKGGGAGLEAGIRETRKSRGRIQLSKGVKFRDFSEYGGPLKQEWGCV